MKLEPRFQIAVKREEEKGHILIVEFATPAAKAWVDAELGKSLTNINPQGEGRLRVWVNHCYDVDQVITYLLLINKNGGAEPEVGFARERASLDASLAGEAPTAEAPREFSDIDYIPVDNQILDWLIECFDRAEEGGIEYTWWDQDTLKEWGIDPTDHPDSGLDPEDVIFRLSNSSEQDLFIPREHMLEGRYYPVDGRLACRNMDNEEIVIDFKTLARMNYFKREHF